MSEQNVEISPNDSIRSDSNSVDLILASVELAEEVREERLSRVSMLRQLRTKFPGAGEDELADAMHQALDQVLGGSLG